MARVKDARLDIYWPFTSGGPDVQVPNDDIRDLTIEGSYQAGRGEGTIVIDNGEFGEAGVYNDQTPNRPAVNKIDIGQKCEIRILTEYNSSATTLGDAAARRWTTYISSIELVEDGVDGNQLRLTVEDYVTAKLARTTIAESFREVVAAASPTNYGIVNEITRLVPGIDDGAVSAVGDKLTIGFNNGPALEAIRRVGKRSGAVLYSDDTSLGFTNISDLTTDATLQNVDYHLPLSNTIDDDSLLNEVVVTGGTSERVQESDLTNNVTQTLTSRVTGAELSVSTPKIPRIDVYTVVNNSTNDIRLRVQNTDGSGNPVDAGDRQLDVGGAVVKNDNLTNGGYTAFGVDVEGEEVDGNNIVLMAETVDNTGSGSSVGTENAVGGTDPDSDSTLETIAHKVYRTYPVVAVAEDATSQDSFGLHSGRVQATDLDPGEADVIAKSKLNRSTPIKETIELDAASAKTHQARPGDVLTVTADTVRAVGSYVVTDVSQQYAGPQLDTEITAVNVDSL